MGHLILGFEEQFKALGQEGCQLDGEEGSCQIVGEELECRKFWMLG